MSDVIPDDLRALIDDALDAGEVTRIDPGATAYEYIWDEDQKQLVLKNEGMRRGWRGPKNRGGGIAPETYRRAQQIRELAATGAYARDIACKLSLDPSTVYNYAKRFDIALAAAPSPIRARRSDDPDHMTPCEKATKAAFRDGMSIKDVMAVTGYTYEITRTALNTLGLRFKDMRGGR